MPACDVLEAGNHTLRRLGASVDRCASPYYTLPEIHPSQLVYTEVDPAEAAEKREREERAAARRKKRQEEAKKNNSKPGGSAGQSSGDGEADHGDDDEEEDNFLGIFLFLKGDFFSVELENALTSIMPAYPRAWVVKANAPSFLSFCVQYDLHTFPQLLLFRNGHLTSRYRGKRSPEGLAAWFSLMIGDLPRAIPRRALPPPPPLSAWAGRAVDLGGPSLRRSQAGHSNPVVCKEEAAGGRRSRGRGRRRRGRGGERRGGGGCPVSEMDRQGFGSE
ncbi:unnamed protein product [Ectocarpus sp. 6 AP-2014]